ncbi:MAG: xanthine/uracil/vitamin C permease [Lachnospiraceae bacterium]|nr:xanthine/uracil/vitamin C permease [Lachnospiraceae bacterium]
MGSNEKVKVPLFKMGDINGVVYVFFGNVGTFLVAIATLQGFGWPDDLIFGRVIPGISVGLLVSGLYYSWMAMRLAKKENRTDVTALPFGLSTPVAMVYLFSVILPLQFGLGLEPVDAWKATIAACFIGGVIEACGGFIGPWIRKWVPRAAMLATVGGIAVCWLATKGLFNVYALPLVGLPVLLVAMLGLIGGYKLPKKIPPLLVALVAGVILALIFNATSITADSFAMLGKFTAPIPAIGELIAGFGKILPVLVAIIPVEIYNFIETMDNVESAIAAGDSYNVREAQIFDGVATCIGALFGAVLPNTVWIGHSGLKRAGCGVGFAWVSGILFAISGWFGIFRFLNDLIPFVVVAIVFLWCAQLIVAQGFVDTPRRYGVAIVVGFIPHIADILYTQTTAIFQGVGADMTEEALAASVNGGAFWYGIEALKNGAIITGMLWAMTICFIIDRSLLKSAFVMFLGAVLTFFGVIHVGELGVHLTTSTINLVIGYLMAAAVILLFHLFRNKLEFERRYDNV